MFDGLGSMMKLLGNKDKIATEAAKLRATIATITGEGSAEGFVTVKASGTMTILSVQFSESSSTLERSLLAEKVMQASNQALQAAREQVAAETQKLAVSLGLPPAMLANIPGLS